MEVGRAWGMQRIVAAILAGNRAIQNVSKRLGFSVLPHEELAPGMVKAVKVL